MTDADAPAGLLVFEGMRVGFQAGDLAINLSDMSMSAYPSTSFDTTVMWLSIAKIHLASANDASQELATRWEEAPERRRNFLLLELGSAMQIVLSCAIVLEVMYDRLKRAGVLRSVEQIWRKNRTARYARISAAVALAFRNPNKEAQQIRSSIQRVFELRDRCVHPSQGLARAARRSGIPVGLDWRFCTYTYENAKVCFEDTVRLIFLLHERRSGIKMVDTDLDFIVGSLRRAGIAIANNDLEQSGPIRPRGASAAS